MDLGAAPGSWLQVAASIVGGKGSVVGVDIAAIEPLKISQVRVFQKDIFDADFIEVLEKQGFAKFDVVLSDVAPSTTGIKERDQALSHELSLRVLEIASQLLKKGGIMVIKVFEGPDTPQLTKQVRKYFSHFDLVKPEASTKGNKERYIIAQNYI